MRVLVLGALAVELDGAPLHVAGSHRRRLLALLASRPRRPVPMDAIVDALWGEDPPSTATKTVQSHVMRLRRSLAEAGSDVLETVPGGYYRLNVEPVAVDAVAFEELTSAAGRDLARGNAAVATTRLAEALGLWRGPAYAEFGDAAFAAAEGARLNELRRVAMEDLAEAQLATGAVTTAIAELERLVVEEPGRERAWALLMRALYAAGRQPHALAAFRRARRALREGFGLEPGAELCALEQRVLQQDPTLAVVGERSLLPPALRASTPFVGRTAELARLRRTWESVLRGSGQVAVLTGPADSGRTRLASELAAEVVDAGGWVEYVRGADGFGALVGAGTDTPLPGAVVDAVTDRCRGGPLLLVVDDAEWMSPAAVTAVVAMSHAVGQLAMLVLLIVDRSGGGPVVEVLRRLPDSATATLAPLADEEIGRVVAADGIGEEAVGAIVAVAGGWPGVARREAAAWAERAASDRLQAAATSALGAIAVSDLARASVFDEVLHLVAARARRSELLSASWVGRQPYRALAAYGPEDADLFVGRERLVAELAARVLDRRMVAVVGASGSGKSSLVRAGLVPLVRSGRLPGGTPWRTNVIVPGHEPLAALAAVDAVDEPGPQLLVIDQFEEVLATDAADAFAGRLVDLVLDAALDVRVVIVVRADQYAMLATTGRLTDLVDDAQLLVGPPTDDELRRIIEVPAQRTGCLVEPALVTLVTDDVVGHEALPLVSAALAEVWERRDSDTLRAATYLEVGGIAAAVDQLGRRAVAQAGDSESIRAVMLRLADVTEDGEWVRRRVAVDELPAELAPAVDALVDARLVVRDDETVDVIHEVVFRAWPQLATWLEAARGDLVLDRELRTAARAWQAQGRLDDDVLRGARLAGATEFVDRHADVPPLVREFVAAGRQFRDRELIEARRRTRRLRILAGVTSVLAAIAVVIGAVAVIQRNDAEQASAAADQSAREADEAATLAEEQRAAADEAATLAGEQRVAADEAARTALIEALVGRAVSIRATQRDTAALLAVEAYRLADSPRTRSALLATFTDDERFLDAHRFDAEHGSSGIVLPDGESAYLVGEADGLLRPYDLESGALGEPLPALGGFPDAFAILAASPDGRLVAQAAWSGDPNEPVTTTIGIFDVSLRSLLFPPVVVDGGVNAATFSTDGGRLAMTIEMEDPRLLVLDAQTGTELAAVPGKTFADGQYPLSGVVAVSDRFVVGSGGTGDGSVRVFDAETLELRSTIAAQARFTNYLQAVGDTTVVGAGQGGQVRIDIQSQSILWEQPGETCRNLTVIASRDALFCGDLFGRLVEKDLSTGVELRRLDAQNGNSGPLWPAHGGTELVSFSDNEPVVARWRLDGSGPIVHLVAPGYGNGRLSPAGDRLIVGAVAPMEDPDERIVDVASGELVATLDGMIDGTWQDDGTVLGGTVNDAGNVQIARREVGGGGGGGVIVDGFVLDPLPRSIVAEPGKERALVEYRDPNSRRSEVSAFDELEGPIEPTIVVDGLVTMAASREGHRIAIGTDHGVYLYDGATGEQLGHIEGDSLRGVYITLADQLFVSSLGGEVTQHDLESLEPVRTFGGSRGYVQDVVGTADGTLIAVRGGDRQVSLFDVATGTLLGTPITIPDDQFNTMDLAQDGRRLVLGGGPDGLQVWDLDPDNWATAACQVAGRNLTRDEWEAHIGDLTPFHATCPGLPIGG